MASDETHLRARDGSAIPPALGAGLTLPHATIGRELGRGGMAVVHEGADFSFTPPRKVAIKLIAAHMSADPEFRARFEREASVVAHFRHDNIVHIYGSGEVRGTRYIVMELLEGGTLAQRIQGGALSPEPVTRIASVLADALGYSHQRGVIHRDFKPGNVLFTGDGKPVLTDFGVAKVVRVDETAMTRHAILVGAPSYMAPEQARAEEVTDRADIYSFGITLFEMLSGHLPVAQDLFPRPGSSEASLASLPATTPPTLARLIRRCLQLDPAQRPSAGECRQWLEGAEPRPPRSQSQLHWWLLAAGVLVVAVMAHALWQVLPSSTDRDADAEPVAIATDTLSRQVPSEKQPVAATRPPKLAAPPDAPADSTTPAQPTPPPPEDVPPQPGLLANQRLITTQPADASIFSGSSKSALAEKILEVTSRTQRIVVVAPGYYGQVLSISARTPPTLNVQLQRHSLPNPSLVPQLLRLIKQPQLLVSQIDALPDPTFRTALHLRFLDQRGMSEERARLDDELVALERRGDTRAGVARYLVNLSQLGDVQGPRNSGSALDNTLTMASALGSAALQLQIGRASDGGDPMATLLYALALRDTAYADARNTSGLRDYCKRMALAAAQGWAAAATPYLQADRCQ